VAGYVFAGEPGEVRAALEAWLSVTFVPVLAGSALEPLDIAALAQGEAAAGAAARPVAVDISRTGARVCPAGMRGASLVFDSLSCVLGEGAPVGALFVVAHKRLPAAVEAEVTQVKAALDEELARQLAVPATLEEAAQLAALTAALEAFSREDEAACDVASTLARYASCHPLVSHVSYPGLVAGQTYAQARRTFEGGFGRTLTLAPAGNPRYFSAVKDATQVVYEALVAAAAQAREDGGPAVVTQLLHNAAGKPLCIEITCAPGDAFAQILQVERALAALDKISK
jgi:O-acetylhomoserine/O-acetylserine sulfhydrylase-like pyridoxal-dependent enzyme